MSRIHEALKKAAIERRERTESATTFGSVPGAISENTPLAVPLARRMPRGAHATDSLDRLRVPVVTGSQQLTSGSDAADFLAPDGAGNQAAPPASAVNSSTVEGLTSEQLRELCPQGSWHPDPGAQMREEALDSTIGREEFRRLRSYLYELRKKQPLRKLLITSALSGEGKTFISANLAQTLAFRPDDAVLVIDGDLRVSRLHRPFGASPEPGLSEYLQGDADIFSIIQRGPLDNLFFVAGGTPKKNPADLIANGRLEVLFRRLAPAFDWIVMDSPPALLVTDAAALAPLCDGVLLVVRAGITQFDMARKALQSFRYKPLLGTVLNGSRPKTRFANYYARSQVNTVKQDDRK